MEGGFKHYLYRNKAVVLWIGLFAAVLGLLRVCFQTVGYDTDEWMLMPESTINTWLGLSRFSLVFLKRIFGYTTSLYVLNIVTYVFVFAYTVLFIWFLNIDASVHNQKRDIVCALALVSSPIFLEQYNFTLQTAEISLGMFLMISSFITTYHFLKYRKTIYGIITIAILVFCFGLYQAFVNVYILGVLFCLYKLNRENKKENITYILKCIIIFLLSFGAYMMVAELVIKAEGIQTTEYLTIGWFSEPFISACKTVVIVLGRVLLGHGNILNLSYTICMFYALWRVIKRKQRISFKNFYWLALLFTPFLLNVITASRLLIRSLLCLPILCTFIFFVFWKGSKVFQGCLYLVLISQVGHCMLLTAGEYTRFKQDIKISSTIYKDCSSGENITIVSKGLEFPEKNGFAFKGQSMGHSFYEWSNGGDNADAVRISYFMKTQGFPVQVPNTEQVNERENLLFESEYPKAGYIQQKDGVYYVNFGK